MGEENLKISKLGQNYAEDYKRFGENILQETANNLAKIRIFPQRKLQVPTFQEPIKGLTVEHNENQEETAEGDDVSAENNSNKSESNTNQYKNDSNEGFSDTKSVKNASYSKLISKEQRIHAKSSSKMSDRKAEAQLGELVNTMDDIDDLGKQHISELNDTELPDGGVLKGGFYYETEGGQGQYNSNYRAVVNNTWQNKSKNFGIIFNGNIGYKAAQEDIGEDDYSKYFDNDDDTNGEKSVEQATDSISGNLQKKTENPQEPSEKDTENQPKPSEAAPSYTKNMTGDFSLKARYSNEDILVGAGVAANFHSPDHKMLDINATVIYLGIGADLIRRTNFVRTSDGQMNSSSEMKLKLDLISNKRHKAEDDPKDQADDVTGETLSDEVSDSGDDSNVAYNQDLKELKVGEKGLANKEKADSINKDLSAFYDSRAGKGFDLDFEYDDSKCGFISTYGFNVVDKQDKGTKLQIGPVLGVYDYNTPGEEEENKEALQVTVGTIVDFSKVYCDGSELSCRTNLVYKRIMEQGSKPSNIGYLTFTGSYDNPKKNFYAGVDAGYIKTDMAFSYVNANINKDFKNFNVRLNVGATNIKGLDLNDSEYQVSAQLTYTIPYGKKK